MYKKRLNINKTLVCKILFITVMIIAFVLMSLIKFNKQKPTFHKDVIKDQITWYLNSNVAPIGRFRVSDEKAIKELLEVKFNKKIDLSIMSDYNQYKDGEVMVIRVISKELKLDEYYDIPVCLSTKENKKIREL